MERIGTRNLWIGGLLACALLAAGTAQSYRLERRVRLSKDSSKDLIYLPTPQQARIMSLGFTTILADYYWVKALQYFTDPYQALNHYRNLADYLDLVVSLDPDFEYAYLFGGISTPYDSGRMRFVNTDRSTSLLERGVRRFPDNWKMRLYLGYNYLNFHDRPKDAAEQFIEASHLPGAPHYLRPFAARLLTVAGDMDAAFTLVEQSLEDETNPELRRLLEQRLIDLQVERELRRIESAAATFQQQKGRLPTNLDELVTSGLLKEVPGGYSLGPDGVAQAPIDTDRMIIHVHPEEAKLKGLPETQDSND